jgi:hypothetical protein
MFSEPFYDPERSYLDNFEHGPFGFLTETAPTSQASEPQNQFSGQPVLAVPLEGDWARRPIRIANHHYTEPLWNGVCGSGMESDICDRNQGAGI